jgi:hypothetical protein
VSEEFEFHFAKGEIKEEQSTDVCIRAEIKFSDCRTLTNISKIQLKRVTLHCHKKLFLLFAYAYIQGCVLVDAIVGQI